MLWVVIFLALCGVALGVTLDESCTAEGVGIHVIDIQNNSTSIHIDSGNGTSIIRCNNTGMWEVDRI